MVFPQPDPRSNLLHCIPITALALLIIVGLIILVILLPVRHARIEYTVENAEIHQFNLTSSDALNAMFNLSLRANNRDHKVSILYYSVEVTVWYSNQMVASTDAAPFFQTKRFVTKIDVSPVARSLPVKGSVARNIKSDMSAGKVELEVRVKARIRLKGVASKSKHYTLKVYCSPVLVHFSSSVPFERVYCDVQI